MKGECVFDYGEFEKDTQNGICGLNQNNDVCDKTRCPIWQIMLLLKKLEEI